MKSSGELFGRGLKTTSVLTCGSHSSAKGEKKEDTDSGGV
jgi:hypothetical protein